jgi:hypothetical protein
MPQSPLPQNPPILDLYSFCLAFTFSFTITFEFENKIEITKKKIHVIVKECCCVFLLSKGTFDTSFNFFFFFLNNLFGPVLRPIVWISKSSSFDHFYKEFGVGST